MLVDTPGVGGLGSAHGAATMSALPSADAVLLVSDAAQEYTGPELEFLGAAMKLCPNVACVVTKTDLYPHWRRIMELDRGHLGAAGIRADAFPVSSTLRLHAAKTQDAELMDESGFRPLVDFLLRRVVGAADELDRRSTSQDVLAVCRAARRGDAGRAGRAGEPRAARAAGGRAHPGEGARRRAQAALGALADHVERRGRRPLVRHRLRPARPAAHDLARGRTAARRRRPGRDLGPVRQLVPPAGGLGGVGQLRVGVRAGPLPVRAGGASTSRRRPRSRCRTCGSTSPGASRRRSTRWRNRTPRASASARRSSRACAAATAACS